MVERAERTRFWLRFAAFALLSIALFWLSMSFDTPVFELVNNREGVEPWLYLAARGLGELITWVVIAALVMIVDMAWRNRRSLLASFERGLIVIWAPMLAGLLGSFLKFAIRRERPDAHEGAYVFRAWDEMTWDSSGLGLPSGHTTVAFAGAFTLSFLYPKLAPIWLLAATLCGLSRLMTQAHFFSDVVAGGIVGFATAWIIWRMYKKWCDGREPVLRRTWHRIHGSAMQHAGELSS